MLYYTTICHVILHYILYIIYYTTFLVGAHRFGVPFPKLQAFSEIFWGLHIDHSQYEKKILGIFVYLFIYEVTTTKVNLCI